jgi:hypothetical protein
MTTIELGMQEQGLGRLLSNLFPYPFEFRGIRCGSMEGFLQSLKFRNSDAQILVASLWGMDAYRTGQFGNDWKETQTLWCNDIPYFRTSKQYQALISDAYDACLENNSVLANALWMTQNAVLDHRIGKNNTADTTLTRSEYISQMYRLRSLVSQAAGSLVISA